MTQIYLLTAQVLVENLNDVEGGAITLTNTLVNTARNYLVFVNQTHAIEKLLLIITTLPKRVLEAERKYNQATIAIC